MIPSDTSTHTHIHISVAATILFTQFNIYRLQACIYIPSAYINSRISFSCPITTKNKGKSFIRKRTKIQNIMFGIYIFKIITGDFTRVSFYLKSQHPDRHSWVVRIRVYYINCYGSYARGIYTELVSEILIDYCI